MRTRFVRLVVCVVAATAFGLPSLRAAGASGAPTSTTSTTVARPDRGDSTSLQQTIQVEVVGATLRATPSVVDVPIKRVGGVAFGELPDITVVDARGTLTGWQLQVAATADTAPKQVIVVPRRIHVVAGNHSAARAGHPRRISGTAPAILARAAAGDGGGTFVAGGRVIAVGKSTRALHLTVSIVGT